MSNKYLKILVQICNRIEIFRVLLYPVLWEYRVLLEKQILKMLDGARFPEVSK